MAVVTQFNHLQFDCTVEEIVLLGRTPHPLLQKEKRGIMPSFKMLSSKWICLRRKLVSIRPCQGEETESLVGTCLGARTDSLAPRRTYQSPGYQVPVRLAGHCEEESQGQCFSCPT